jgi:hypothetical protein
MKQSVISVFFVISVLLLDTLIVHAQDSIKGKVKREYITEAFWGTRVLNGHSLETSDKGVLELKIQHRMGRLNEGFDNLFGLDHAAMRFGLEYGILDWLMIGAGRTTLDKFWDGFVKVRMLRQSKGRRAIPFSITGLANMGITSAKWSDPSRKNYFSSRLYYAFQIIIGGKYWDRLSLQISPTLVHKNLVTASGDKNDILGLGFAGRVRVSNMVALLAEGYYVFPKQIYSQINGSDLTSNISGGVEIYTGKHVFQIMVTNSTGMCEKQFIAENTENWKHSGIHLGFNITRLFQVAY